MGNRQQLDIALFILGELNSRNLVEVQVQFNTGGRNVFDCAYLIMEEVQHFQVAKSEGVRVYGRDPAVHELEM